jgi:hypothetical protein
VRLWIGFPRGPMRRVTPSPIYQTLSSRAAVSCAGSWAAVAASLNGRPRKTLGYLNPCEKLAQLVALAP